MVGRALRPLILALACVIVSAGAERAVAQAPPDTLLDDAQVWADRARTRERMGMLAEASRLFRRAAGATDDVEEKAEFLSNSATAADRAGLTAEAAALLEEAGELASGPDVGGERAALILTNWAQLRLREGRWEASEAIALRASERARAVGAGTAESRAWRIIADARRLLGRPEDARRALDAAERAGPSPREALEIGFVRGLLDLDAGDAPEAARVLRTVSDLAQEAEDRPVELRARLALAEAETARGQPDAAILATQRAEAIARDARDLADVEQRRVAIAVARGRSEEALEHTRRCLERTDEWLNSARGKAERDARRTAIRGYVETAFTIWFAEDDGPLDAGTAATALAWMRRVRGRERMITAEPEGDDVSVAWFWGATRVLGLLSWREGDEVRHRSYLVGSPAELREWILLFRGLLADPDQAMQRDEVGALLASRLLPEPATGSRGRLLVEADGALHALPLAALPTASGPLGVARAIVDESRGCPPVRSAEEPSVETRILADPALAPEIRPLGALPGAREEARAIARADPRARVFFGADAAEARIGEPPPAAILHVAAHTDPDSPTPALLLAPGEGHDGRLEPDEIRRVESPPHIVVLSGCETALADVPGRTAVGEIGAAFLDAGSSTVIGALWKVEDRSLGKFMTAVHERLLDGDRPSEALRRARGAMLLSDRPELTDPFLWGAFAVWGCDEPLATTPFLAPASASRIPDAVLGFASAVGLLVMLVWTRRTGADRGGITG